MINQCLSIINCMQQYLPLKPTQIFNVVLISAFNLINEHTTFHCRIPFAHSSSDYFLWSASALISYQNIAPMCRILDILIMMYHVFIPPAWWAVRLYSCILHRLHEAVYCKGKFALDYSIHWSSDELHQMKYVHHIQT